MKTRQLIITAAMLAVTGGAMAQTQVPASPGMVAPASTANGVSNDPYVQKRQSDADAKPSTRRTRSRSISKARLTRRLPSKR